MNDPALAAEVAKLGVKIDGLGKQMGAIGEHVRTLADSVGKITAPPTPSERLRRAFSDWAPVIVILIGLLAAGASFNDRLKSNEQALLSLSHEMGELKGSISSLKDSVSDLRRTPAPPPMAPK